jgi:Tol biopolymer transport system component/predicted Ser/Thr protein kinase
MGEVYKAHDPTLQRTVAIKVLAKQDEEASNRLLQEARVASALNHPHICTVHEVGEHEGQAFIVMEHVEGKPLSELIPADGLPPESVIRYGTQIADALAHAHERGIVHRDLKSANVVITPEGRAKVLDFGLAARMPQAEAAAVTKTQEALPHAGMLVGTLGYMAPEVLRGEAATARSDIWALGVLLYEMASGKQPFTGTTQTDVVSAIVKETPPPLPEKVSPGLRTVIQHCLTKEPARRYPHPSAIQAGLETIQSDAAVTQPLGIASGNETRTWRTAAVVVGVTAAVALVAVAFWRPAPPTTSTPSVPRLVNPAQVTSASGVERDVAWSPDGVTLAFESNQAGSRDIWITQVGSSQPVNRTADYDGRDTDPSWSPDGTEIAFSSSRDGGGIFLMSALGGSPRKLVSADGGLTRYPRWSTDGSALAFLRQFDDGGVRLDVIEIVSLAGEVRERVSVPPGDGAVADLRWSPDRQWFTYIWTVDRNLADVTRLWLLPVGEDQAIALSDGQTKIASPQWTPDGRSLQFVSNRGGSMDLWQQRLSADGSLDGEPEPLTTGLQLRDASLSPLGDRVAYSRGRRVANLWRFPIWRDRPTTWADAEQVTFDEAYTEQFDLSPDETRMALSSDRSGNPDLWILSLQTGDLRQLTTDRTPDWAPVWSPDGQTLAFYSSRSGNRDIWTMPAGGGPATRLTADEGIDWYPAWSSDGQRIAFQSWRGGRVNVWVVSAESGTDPEQVTEAGGARPRFSPDGEWLAFRANRDGRGGRFWVRPVAGGEAEPLSEPAGGFPRWSPDGRQVYFARTRNSASNVWVVPLADRVERQVTDLRGRRGKAGPGLAVGTEFLYRAWGEDTGDIWVMDVVQDEDDGSND